jgi:hypothetical protein
MSEAGNLNCRNSLSIRGPYSLVLPGLVATNGTGRRRWSERLSQSVAL